MRICPRDIMPVDNELQTRHKSQQRRKKNSDTETVPTLQLLFQCCNSCLQRLWPRYSRSPGVEMYRWRRYCHLQELHSAHRWKMAEDVVLDYDVHLSCSVSDKHYPAPIWRFYDSSAICKCHDCHHILTYLHTVQSL